MGSFGLYTWYIQTMNTAITYHLHDYFGVDATIDHVNPTTLLRQATVAQEWLLTKYLSTWLEVVGSLVECDYPLAKSNAINLRAVAGLREHLDPAADHATLSFLLASVDRNLRHLALYTKLPQDRAMQWGIWARDVPMSIAHALTEQPFLDGAICKEIASCCMYAAFVVSQIVTDSGVADELEMRLFEEMPMELLGLLSAVPAAPEA